MSRAPDSLVSTKLCPSQTRPKLIARPRLTARLEWEAGRKLTLVCAPVEFGKTTLLVEWLKGRQGGERSVARLSLDEGDNNLVRFLLHHVAALRTVKEGMGEGVLAAMRSSKPPRVDAMAGALAGGSVAGVPGGGAFGRRLGHDRRDNGSPHGRLHGGGRLPARGDHRGEGREWVRPRG